MRVRLRFDGIEVGSLLVKGSRINSEDFVCFPTGAGNQSDNRTSSHDSTVVKANKILVAGDRSSQEDPIPPFLIQFGAQALRDEPENGFPEFAYSLSCLAPVQPPPCSPGVRAKLVFVEKIRGMLNSPRNDSMP